MPQRSYFLIIICMKNLRGLENCVAFFALLGFMVCLPHMNLQMDPQVCLAFQQLFAHSAKCLS